MKRFTEFNIPESWQQYWTQYPEGYTIMESLIDWIGKVNDMVDNQNATVDTVENFGDRLDEFIDAYANNLSSTTEEILSEWQASGFLDVVIDAALQTQMDVLEQETEQKLADVNTQLADTTKKTLDNSISPDFFSGSDFEKVQQAINEAIANNQAIRFSRMYDVTNETPLIIDRSNSRIPLRFIGVGGGLIKTNGGFMFDTNNSYIGDLFYQMMVFEGVEGSGLKIFNGDNIIRVKSIACLYRDVDTIAYADLKYLQSYDFIGDLIVGGQDASIKAPAFYAVSCANLLVEHRQNFLEHTQEKPDGNGRYVFDAKFRDCTIEGLEGYAFFFRGVINLTIDGCYFEKNKAGHIIFDSSSLNRTTFIGNNRVFESEDQTSTNASAFIEWGRDAQYAISSNNHVDNIPIHDVTNLASGQFLKSVDEYNDAGFLVGDEKKILKENRLREWADVNGTTVSNFGSLKRLYKTTSSTLYRLQKKTIQVDMGEAIYLDDIISVQTVYAEGLVVHGWKRDDTDKNLINIIVSNTLDAETELFHFSITVLKPYFSVKN